MSRENLCGCADVTVAMTKQHEVAQRQVDRQGFQPTSRDLGVSFRASGIRSKAFVAGHLMCMTSVIMSPMQTS
jgi:hypothetical protein